MSTSIGFVYSYAHDSHAHVFPLWSTGLSGLVFFQRAGSEPNDRKIQEKHEARDFVVTLLQERERARERESERERENTPYNGWS